MADGVVYYCFKVNAMIRGYHIHIYNQIWDNPIIGEKLICSQEIGNPMQEPLSVAVMKLSYHWRKCNY